MLPNLRLLFCFLVIAGCANRESDEPHVLNTVQIVDASGAPIVDDSYDPNPMFERVFLNVSGNYSISDDGELQMEDRGTGCSILKVDKAGPLPEPVNLDAIENSLVSGRIALFIINKDSKMYDRRKKLIDLAAKEKLVVIELSNFNKFYVLDVGPAKSWKDIAINTLRDL